MSTKPDMQAQINLLDGAYQKITGLKFRLSGVVTGREEAWCRYIQAGFTLEDLERTLLWLKQRVREGKRDIGCYRFSTLLGDLSRFTEEEAYSRAEARKPMRSAKDTVLAQARPVAGDGTPALVPDTSKPVGNVIPKLIEAMREAIK